MDTNILHDPVIARFRDAVRKLYGDRLERLVLFGSRARGDYGPDSDYDIAVFIRDPGTLWEEAGRLADIETAILLDTDGVISAVPLRAGSHANRTLFMHEVRKDGVDL